MSNQTVHPNPIIVISINILACENNIFERIHKSIKYLKVRKNNCQDSIILV